MVSRRRGTYWMSFSEGATLLTMAPGATSRLLIPSLRETEAGREYEGYTVTRMLLNIFIQSTGAEAIVTFGVILQTESVAVGQVGPVQEPHADWLWQEDLVTGPSTDEPLRIHRDIRSQRKSRGGENEFYVYAVSRSGVISVELHRSGRVLVKRA